MNLYELCDWKAIEHHLARQAAKGWRLRRAEGSFWRYERAEPACVQYEVTYLPLRRRDDAAAPIPICRSWTPSAQPPVGGMWPNGTGCRSMKTKPQTPPRSRPTSGCGCRPSTRRCCGGISPRWPLVCLLELMLLGIMVIPLQITQITMPVLSICFIPLPFVCAAGIRRILCVVRHSQPGRAS